MHCIDAPHKRAAQVTDGGHIDNSAVVPMLRFKPTRIIAVDGGSDPKDEFYALKVMMTLVGLQ